MRSSRNANRAGRDADGAMSAASLDLYLARSPVAFKVLIALEEMNLPYNPIPIDVTTGEQLTARYSALNPNQRIPALVDHAPADGAARLAPAAQQILFGWKSVS